ncbi:MAG: cupin domain-containing protein [Methylococcales bacterium]|jgi:cupin 2 domain-containing protein|nr:cupin domain-containing protein [Methylococcales bacterium]MBT4664245.1 cupin domain-containing protein [Methylococcales bacterium]
MNNLLTSLPNHIDHEQVEELLSQPNVKIERILSKGQTSPETGWYDQDKNEWVVVLQGAGDITFDDGDKVRLQPGDHLNIPAHRRHKVSWTDPDSVTVWLAVFYQ